jgi:hypothetical protein
MPGWDPMSREGHCLIRVWVDSRAEVSMRGDRISVKTLEGARAHDEGSECSQPIPYNNVRNFQIRKTAGRSQVALAQEPSRLNNYTAMITVEDRQGGGDSYAFDVSWRAEPAEIVNAPAPFFDDVRGCQEMVRQSFLSRNGRGSYVDFDNIPDRRVQNVNQLVGDNRGPRNRGQNDQETITGAGIARSWNETRNVTYTCVVNPRQQQVLSAIYQLSGNGYRMPNGRTTLR